MSSYFRAKRENKVLTKSGSYFRAKRENKVLTKSGSYFSSDSEKNKVLTKSGSYFISPTKGKMDFLRLIDELIGFVLENPRATYRLIVGTDSDGKERPNFICAIVIHRQGRGGRFFYKKISPQKTYTLRTRIYEETMLSLSLATKLRERLEKKLEKISPKNYKNLEIHTDIGQSGETREMIKEIVSMVQGNGFEVKIKPESFGASCVADRCLR